MGWRLLIAPVLLGTVALMVGCSSDDAGSGRTPPSSSAAPSSPSSAPTPGLDATDRATLARARLTGSTTVICAVTVRPGRRAEAVDAIRSLGGVFTPDPPTSDVFRVTVPIRQAEAVAALPSVRSVNVEPVAAPGGHRPTTP